MHENTSGANNTTIGRAALYNNTTGSSNVAIGHLAGYSNVTGSNNVFIGNRAGLNETGSNTLYIDNSDTDTPLIKGDFVANELTINGSMTVTGSLTADVINDTGGNQYIRRDAATGAIHVGQNSMVFDDASGSIGNGRDIMSSSVGQIQIGKNASDTTTFVGNVHVPDPTSNASATNRRYVDSAALMAATLDTRLPPNGENKRLSVSSAHMHGLSATSLNFVGVTQHKDKPVDFSLGVASSTNETMGKVSVGISW